MFAFLPHCCVARADAAAVDHLVLSDYLDEFLEFGGGDAHEKKYRCTETPVKSRGGKLRKADLTSKLPAYGLFAEP